MNKDEWILQYLSLSLQDYGDDKGKMEADGDEDAEWDGDRWRYCGSPRGMASKIQDAIDELIDAICERDGVDEIKYQWSWSL